TLVVAEMEDKGDRRETIREGVLLPIVASAPVNFGADAGRCALVVAPVAGVQSDELFRITLNGGGDLNVTAVAGAVLNGEPVPERGLTFRYRQPFRVRVFTREWQIALVESQAES